ncbi:hypothetical protein BD770DRAFT_416286 [Pilaira anomala]|nr:hypothetical protein BD770DRAFT_416286 [Pilaira anomala]
MNYIEDRIAEKTGILIVGLMPSPSWDDDRENVFFNGRRELFWRFAVQFGIVPNDDMEDLVENHFYSFIYLVNEAHRSFTQVPEEEVEEGLQKVQRFIEVEEPRTVIVVGKQIGLRWWGRPIRPAGPIHDEEDLDVYLLPELSQGFFGTSKNQFFSLLKASGFIEAENNEAAFEPYNMSFMNYVDMPTRSEKEIKNDELLHGKHRLEQVVEEYKPRVLYVPRTNNEVEFGIQDRKVKDRVVICVPHGSTEGAQMKFEDKLKIYHQLFTLLNKNI